MNSIAKHYSWRRQPITLMVYPTGDDYIQQDIMPLAMALVFDRTGLRNVKESLPYLDDSHNPHVYIPLLLVGWIWKMNHGISHVDSQLPIYYYYIMLFNKLGFRLQNGPINTLGECQKRIIAVLDEKCDPAEHYSSG